MMLNKRKQREQIKKQYGNNPINDPYHHMRRDRRKLIAKYHEDKGGSDVDEITWDDLEMDEVFYRINHTRSYIGEQVLYHKLHCLNEDNADGFCDAVDYYDKNDEARTDAEFELLRIGKRNTSYYMPQLIRILSEFELPFAWCYRILQAALVIAVLLSVALRSAECAVLLLGIACTNLFLYMRTKSKAEYMMDCLYGICSLIDVSEELLKKGCVPENLVYEGISEDLKRLHRLKKLAGGLVTKKNYAVTDPQGMLADYLMGITLYDLVSFHKITQIVKGNEKAVMKLYELVGEVDMSISVASFRKSLPDYCIPEFSKDNRINVCDIYHPLIENAVLNSVNLGNSTMIMGANASGKSTFMKALAVNAILAQSIYTCCAKRLEIPRSVVMTSMAVRDDVLTGESYYVREVRYLKRMLDESKKGGRVLYFIDEILKGTNYRERLAASKAVLSYLSGKNGMVIVSTHDGELAKYLKHEYSGYHFESRLTDDGIKFDYRIKSGFGEGSNAIDLLLCYDFPREVVEDAKKLVKSNIA
jgi:hypothetical protein